MKEIFRPIWTSASDIAFIMVAVSVCVGLFTKNITQENFMWIATAVFSFYFGKAATNAPNRSTDKPVVTEVKPKE